MTSEDNIIHSVEYEHTKTAKELAIELKTDLAAGLPSAAEVSRRLQLFGFNELTGVGDGIKWWKIVIAQLTNALTFILMVAVALSIYKKDWVECGVIGFVIVTNTIMGFIQEYRAEKTMEALRRMASPTAKVLRETTVEHIASRNVVPGDIILVEEGDTVPADARLIECFHLEVDEALLTGESLPVCKNLDVIENKEQSIGDRLNLIYSSTTVTRGRGKAIVTKTGNHTQMGTIATELHKASQDSATNSQQKTPLQQGMAYLAYFCFVLVAILTLIVFGVNQFIITDSIIGYAISVGIAMIPEGLLVVVTITMAVGVRNMANQLAIVRKVLALENIGSVTTICSDKTGTLTQGKMVLKQVYVPDLGTMSVTGEGYKPAGEIRQTQTDDGKDLEMPSEPLNSSNMRPPLLRLTECAALCNMAIIKKKGITEEEQLERVLYPAKSKKNSPSKASKKAKAPLLSHHSGGLATEFEKWEAIGDPTEAALQAYAWKANLSKQSLASISTSAAPYCFDLLQEYSFDAVLKRMSVIYRENCREGSSTDKIYWTFVKGSVECILELSTGRMKIDGAVKRFESTEKEEFTRKIIRQMETMADKGLRVLALACKFSSEAPSETMKREEVERDLIFLGIVGIYDPPRPESKASVAQCYQAGISVHMLTGDHPKTAANIAREIGILPQNYQQGVDIMPAVEFDNIPDERLAEMRLPRVIARCSPTTKVKMVNALQARKQIVVMTGDGTNDAPSLKRANIGVAMGMAGSDVAKQASDIILTDDNFATIVKAVAEGRRIFSNVQKFVVHLMSTNVGEIIALVIGLAFKDQLSQSVFPMSPLQILVLNMLTSSPPAIGLGMESASPDQMKKPPRDSSKRGSGVFSVEVISDIFYSGTVMGVLSLLVWIVCLYSGFEPNASIGLLTPLGYGCNDSTADLNICDRVFRARGACYASLSLIILIHAYNCRSLRYSIIRSEKYGPRSYAKNRVLCIAVVVGVLVTIISLYIPGLNTSVLLHKPISWEWGPVIVSLVLFVAFMELYKYAKRHWFSDSFFAAEYNHNLEYSKNDDPVEMVVIPDPVKSQRV